MGRGLKAGLVVEVLVLVTATVYSAVYFRQSLYASNRGFDITLVILWVVVAALLLLVLWWRSLLREDMVRRFYLSEDFAYNHEIGYAPLSRLAPNGNPYDFVSYAADALATMSYGFEVAETPVRFVPKLLISTRSFFYRSTGDEGVVVDVWKGMLQTVETDDAGEHVYTEVGKFRNAKELARLLEEQGAFA